MRSRYTAFAKRKFAYLAKTVSGPAAREFDISAVRHDAPLIKWLKLEVLRAEEAGDQGLVEFNAHFRFQGKVSMMHEISRFEKSNGEWFYVGRDNDLATKTIQDKTAPKLKTAKKFQVMPNGK